MGITISTKPPPRGRVPRRHRLSDKIKAMRPGQSLTADFATAECAVKHFRREGFVCMTQLLPRRRMTVWILKAK